MPSNLSMVFCTHNPAHMIKHKTCDVVAIPTGTNAIRVAVEAVPAGGTKLTALPFEVRVTDAGGEVGGIAHAATTA